MSFRQLAVSLQPFIDPGGEVYITVDIDGQAQAEVIPLDSRQARSIVRSRLCDVIKRGFPTDHETRTALDVLYGYAYEQKRQEAKASLDYLIARKPLAQAVILMAKKGGTQKTPKQLLAAVNNVALTNGIDTKSGPWPTSEDSLGKQLSSLAGLLKRKGVVIEPGRSDERYWTIHCYSAASDESVGDVTSEIAESSGVSAQPDTWTPQPPALANRLVVDPADDIPNTELNNLMNGAMK